MSTCTSQDTYISQGTISVHCSISKNSPEIRKNSPEIRKNSPEMHLIFVPSNDYSVKHRNKTFAAFVPQSCGCTLDSCGCGPDSCGCGPDSCGCKPGFCNRAIIREYDREKGRGVKIGMDEPSCMEAISGAALRGTKVELEVKDCILAATMNAKKKLAQAVKKAAEAEASKKAAEAEASKKAAEAELAEAAEAELAEAAEAELAKAAKKAVKAAENAKTAKKELMKAIYEDSPCLRLTDITVPAK